MKTSNDYSRQASLFTMNGLIDPRLMPDYVSPKEKTKNAIELTSLFGSFLKYLERITGLKLGKGPAHA